jgi:2-polyprenyl-6-methoxyphenol hydroxylase-like FAD-dependent oxidoreductase
MYDALIIGARPAGSSTAMLLARKGYRVLIVDKASFPSDAPRGHFIQAPGVALLKKWGLLDRVIATNCPPISQISFDLGPFALTATIPPIDGVSVSYAPRHEVIDNLLYQAAQEAGAEGRERFLVQDLLWDEGKVTGIRGRDASGKTVTETARMVIGADGLHSIVARTVQAPTYHEKPTLSVAYFAYYSNLSIDTARLYTRENGMFGVFSTNDNQTCVFVQIPYREFHEFRKDVTGNFERSLATVPEIVELLQNSERVGNVLAYSDMPNLFRKPYGPGWALVGDAGYHKDPITGQGFTDAFFSAQLLADALDAGFSGQSPMEAALAAYEQQRNEHVMPMFDFVCQLASFEPPSPEMQQLFQALYGNEKETSRFLGTIAGTVRIPEFFHPENIERIIAAAHRTAQPIAG